MRRWIGAFVLGLLLGSVSISLSAQNYMFGAINGRPFAPGILLGDGTAAAPSLTFANDVTKGLFSGGASNVSLALDGTSYARWDGAMTLHSATALGWGPTTAASTADLTLARGGAGRLNLSDADGTPDLNLNVSGAPTLSACGTGTLATGSSNSSGRVDIVGATACTLTFSASFGGNSADCVITNVTTEASGFVSAASATAFTISSVVDGDDVMYVCVGR